MKNNSKITIIIAVLAVVVIFVGFYREKQKKVENQESAQTAFKSLVGKPAPQFKVTDRAGKEYTNDSLKGKTVILFFNEGLACYPACWDQMKQLSSDSRFNTDDTVAYSVVMDTKDSWQTATTKMPELAKVNVLFDDGSASRAFGASNAPSSMHGGVPGHSYVLVDKNGVIRYVLDDPRMAINNDKIAEQVEKIKK